MGKLCSICSTESDHLVHSTKTWNSYEGSVYFGEQEHAYAFCESCIHDMAVGNPLKGRLTHFITGDPRISWEGLNMETLPEEERQKYSENFAKLLREPFENV